MSTALAEYNTESHWTLYSKTLLKNAGEVLVDGEIQLILLSEQKKKKTKRDVSILNTTHSIVSLVGLPQKVPNTGCYDWNAASRQSKTPRREWRLSRLLWNNKSRPARDKKP